jgi:hypothetical protein
LGDVRGQHAKTNISICAEILRRHQNEWLA